MKNKVRGGDTVRKLQILLLVFFTGTALSIVVTSVLMFRISGRAEMLRLDGDLRYKLETTAMAFNDYLIKMKSARKNSTRV